MRTPVLLAMLACQALPVTGIAATEFEDSVPLELVQALLGNPESGEVRVYSDRPDNFPEFELPDQSEILGSVDQGSYLRVVIKSTQTAEAAREQLSSELLQRGFVSMEIGPDVDQQRGFVPATPRQVPSQFCRDDTGTISLSVSDTGQARLLSLATSRFGIQAGQTCAQRIQEQEDARTRFALRSRATGLNRYMPRLEVPVNPMRMPMFAGPSNSGSGTSRESEFELVSDWTLEQVVGHFTGQLRAQGWESDSESIGERSANSGWTHTPEAGLEVAGNLTVLKAGEDRYQLKFQLVLVSGTIPGNTPAQGTPGFTPFRGGL